MKQFRVALVGAGGKGALTGKLITEHLNELATVQVVCDISEAAARKVKESLGAKEYCTDFRSAVDRPDVDAVLVVTPPGLHRDITAAAAQSKKHVFCEKPIAVELAHADEMIAACEKAGVALMIGHQFRYTQCRLALREMLMQGVIGRPVVWREVLPLYSDPMKWVRSNELGGGCIFEYSHSIDFACYTFGPPESVSAQVFSFQEGSEWQSHNSYSYQIRFLSGDIHQLSGFGVLPAGMNSDKTFGGSHRLRMNDIVGDKGAVYIGADAEGQMGMVVAEHIGTDRHRVTTYPWGLGAGGYSDPTEPSIPMLTEFFTAIRTGGFVTRNSPQEARQTLAVVQAGLESSRTGKTVFLSKGQ